MNHVTRALSVVAIGACAALTLPGSAHAGTVRDLARPLDYRVLGDVPANRLRFSRYIGPVAANKLVTLNVHLAYPHPEAVARLADVLSDPSSPMYGHFLRPAQFVANFSPTVASYRAVQRELESHGLHVTRTWGNRKYVTVAARAATVQSYFRTRLARVAYEGREHFVNVTPALTPPALAHTVMAVSGLDDFEMKSHYAAVPAGSRGGRDVLVPMPIPNPPGTTLPAAVQPAGVNPPQLQAAYDYPIHANATVTGVGTTIAIEAAYGFSPADIYAFWDAFGVKRTGTLSEIDPDGNVPAPTHPTDSAEVTLDVEQSTSAAPGANEKVFTVPAPLVILLQDTYNAVASDGTVDVVSTSFGSCEINTTAADFAADDDLFTQGSIEGQTMFAAAGDTGSADCRSNTADTVDFPASSPEVGSAGGTTLKLTSTNAIASETSWSCDPTTTGATGGACSNGAGGGGVSGHWGIPPWQTGITTAASKTMRNAPDVSLNADLDTSYAAIFFGTATLGYGGTSLVGPNLAGIYAEMEQVSQHRMGRSSTSLYYAYQHRINPYASVFHDITAGQNGDTAYALSVGFKSGPGFDNTTGWGSLDANALMKSLPVVSGPSNL